MQPTLTLPAELTIYGVTQLRCDWRAALDALPAAVGDEPAACVADAAAVCEVDAAGAQLLIALAQGLALARRKLQLADPSPALANACQALGLASLLDAAARTGDGA